MISMFRNLLRWARSFWMRPVSTEAAPLPSQEPSLPAPEASASPKRVRRRIEPEPLDDADSAEFRFRGGILDQLGDYMRYIKRLRSHDRDAYDLYSKVGAQLLPATFLASTETLDPWFRVNLPSFGAIALVGEHWHEKEREWGGGKMMARFMYFRKMARAPARVQLPNAGTIYEVTAFFAARENENCTAPVTFPVVVDGDAVRPLLMLVQENQVIRHKRTIEGQSNYSTVTKQRWGVHATLRDWAAENDDTPASHCAHVFKFLANHYAQSANGMIRVEARRKNLVAVFAVDILRTPQFFADRDPPEVDTAKGRRGRVFHIVRTHSRTLKSGKTIHIKTHFSGLAQFQWNGYRVSITVPGRDHVALTDAKFGAYDAETLSEQEMAGELMNAKTAGAYIERALTRAQRPMAGRGGKQA